MKNTSFKAFHRRLKPFFPHPCVAKLLSQHCPNTQTQALAQSSRGLLGEFLACTTLTTSRWCLQSRCSETTGQHQPFLTHACLTSLESISLTFLFSQSLHILLEAFSHSVSPHWALLSLNNCLTTGNNMCLPPTGPPPPLLWSPAPLMFFLPFLLWPRWGSIPDGRLLN